MKAGINVRDIRKTPKVYVEWIDSYAQHGWRHEDDLGNSQTFDSRIVSIGFLIKDTAEFITISNSVGTGGSINDPLTIPKVAIKKLKKI